MPCSRATSVGDAPGARLWAAIVCFCSVVQRRRRSPRGIKSIRRDGALLRLVVCALSVDAAVSAGGRSVSMEGGQHTQPWGSHVGAAQRLPAQDGMIAHHHPPTDRTAGSPSGMHGGGAEPVRAILGNPIGAQLPREEGGGSATHHGLADTNPRITT